MRLTRFAITWLVCGTLDDIEDLLHLADGGPAKGNFIVGSPLAVAFASRAVARWCLGRRGWRDDQRYGLAMARSAGPLSYATVVTYVYNPGIPNGVLRPDDSVVGEIEDALRIAERSADDLALSIARMATEHRRSRPSTFHAPRQQVSEARPHRWNCSRKSCSSLSGSGRRRGWVATSASGIRCSGFGCSC